MLFRLALKLATLAARAKDNQRPTLRTYVANAGAQAR